MEFEFIKPKPGEPMMPDGRPWTFLEKIRLIIEAGRLPVGDYGAFLGLLKRDGIDFRAFESFRREVAERFEAAKKKKNLKKKRKT